MNNDVTYLYFSSTALPGKGLLKGFSYELHLTEHITNTFWNASFNNKPQTVSPCKVQILKPGTESKKSHCKTRGNIFKYVAIICTRFNFHSYPRRILAVHFFSWKLWRRMNHDHEYAGIRLFSRLNNSGPWEYTNLLIFVYIYKRNTIFGKSKIVTPGSFCSWRELKSLKGLYR